MMFAECVGNVYIVNMLLKFTSQPGAVVLASTDSILAGSFGGMARPFIWLLSYCYCNRRGS